MGTGPKVPPLSFAAYTREMIAAGCSLDLSTPGSARLIDPPVTFDAWKAAVR